MYISIINLKQMLIYGILNLILIINGLQIPNNDEKWLEWKKLYKKLYKPEEELKRYEKWKLNLISINNHNQRHAHGLESYEKGLNQFSDLDWSEIQTHYLPYIMKNVTDNHTSHNDNNNINVSDQSFNLQSVWKPSQDTPIEWDWRKSGIVSEVPLQGTCGACWAFAAAGALEGQLRNKTGQFKRLSAQQLIDCSKPFGNHGCLGGDMNKAFHYVRKYGIQADENYPYISKEGICQHETNKSVVHAKSIIHIPVKDEEQIKNMVYEHGPVAAAIMVEHPLMNYKQGIYDSETCISDKVNHGVLIVGYGEIDNKSYWIIRNSWGQTWGENGYLLLKRNENMCGIGLLASIPLL